MRVAYYSATRRTLNLVKKLTATPIPIRQDTSIREPYILVTPTYQGAIPVPVQRFLQSPENRQYLMGVVGTGNRNYGALRFGAAGRQISKNLGVPLVHTCEMSGLPHDIEIVKSYMEKS